MNFHRPDSHIPSIQLWKQSGAQMSLLRAMFDALHRPCLHRRSPMTLIAINESSEVLFLPHTVPDLVKKKKSKDE